MQGFIATEGDYRLTLEREGAEAVRLTGKTSASMTPSPTNPSQSRACGRGDVCGYAYTF